MSTPLRFVVWLFLLLPVAFGVDALVSGFSGSGVALQSACNLLLGWLFGLIRFQNRLEIGTSILAIIFALSMPFILPFFAIVATLLFCGKPYAC